MSKYPNLSKISVLYVEDNENIRNIFSNILKRFINKLHIANNGEEGLKKFKELKPDLIITDIQMPKMNGIETVSYTHLRAPRDS
jgi:two-component system cell cycle response regulator